MTKQIIGFMTAAAFALSTPLLADDKAAEILAAARKAIGQPAIDALKSLTVQASVQRNSGNVQIQSESELWLEMPDKYLRSDVSSGPMSMSMNSGFNGDRPIIPAGASMASGGAMVFRMGPGGAMSHGEPAEKPTPEQQEQMNKTLVRNSRQELSRLMLGWFATVHPAVKAQYTYAGEAESPDGKAHVIDVKDDDGFAARLFIDQQTKLPLMVTYKGRAPRIVTNRAEGGRVTSGQPAKQLSEEEVKKLRETRDQQLHQLKTEATQVPLVDVSLFFEDWREADGLKFAHVLRRAAEGTTNEEWKVNKVKVNPRIDAKKFTIETR